MIDFTKALRAPCRRSLVAGAALTILFAGGCDGGETGSSGGATSSTSTLASTCSDDPRAEVYKVGMKGASSDGAIMVTFEDADPSPPAKGNNTWMVKLTDAAGKPLNGATIETKAYMPDHGHESSIKPKATPMGSDGSYEVTPINLFMPGVWEVTLTVTPMGGAAASIKFTFCVAG